VHPKVKQFLLLIKHPPCYSYIQSGPVKILSVIEERKQIRNALDKEVNKINDNKMQLSILYYKQNLVNKIRKHQSHNHVWTNQRN
jgi:hypothetical protein